MIDNEATDINHHEQTCITVRWVGDQNEVHEAALGLVELPDTKATTLFSVLRDVLTRCSLPVSSCVGQAFDSASNMSGKRSGVQALRKKENPKGLYVHCFAHSLNLAVQGVTCSCDALRDMMDFTVIKHCPTHQILSEAAALV